MRHYVSAACGLWLAAMAQVQAEPVVVVELYTSQGCSSCPPADEFLAMLASDPRILPLALHVDYWDYIGWEDKFALAQFTDRQKALEIRPGMLADVELETGGKTILTYLLKPLYKSSEALRER